MANLNNPKGFLPQGLTDKSYILEYPVADSETINIGDVLYMEVATGHLTITRQAGLIVGVAISKIIDGITGDNNAISSATTGEDKILVNCDPNLVMIAQISTGADTDPATTASSATCFDIAGTTGIQYINAGASAQDEIKVIGTAYENNGSKSAVGAYRKVLCKFNGLMHIFGTKA